MCGEFLRVSLQYQPWFRFGDQLWKAAQTLLPVCYISFFFPQDGVLVLNLKMLYRVYSLYNREMKEEKRSENKWQWESYVNCHECQVAQCKQYAYSGQKDKLPGGPSDLRIVYKGCQVGSKFVIWKVMNKSWRVLQGRIVWQK